MFLCFMLLAAWNFKIGLDFLKSQFNLFAALNFLVVLLFFSALGSSIKSRKKAMEAYQIYLRKHRKKPKEAITQKTN
jgi:ABC-type Na+ efflux pump permease subunit